MAKSKKAKPKVIKDSDFIFTSFQPDNQVTGSAFLLEIPREDLKILIDAGVFQDSRYNAKQSFDINKRKVSKIPWRELTHIIVSHAHLDHMGSLPLACVPELQFEGKIICTEASQSLIALNAKDCAFVMDNQAKVWNKANPKKPILPLYTMEHADSLITRLQGYGYYEQIQLTPNVSVELVPTGHLLGDCSIIITYMIDEWTTRRVFYSGDTNAWTNNPKPFTRQFDTSRIYDCDIVICESTYGVRLHEPMDVVGRLENIIQKRCIEQHHVLFIPAFAIGRSAQVCYYLKQVFDKHPEWNKINLPIYLAGKMLLSSFNTYGNPYNQRHFMDEEWSDTGIFNWGRIQKIDNFPEVEEKLTDNKPKIIIASSGMVTGGYSTYLAQQLIGREKVTILMSGYVGEGTYGRAILDTINKEKKQVTIQGAKYNVRCNVEERLSLSGHGDYNQLINLVTKSMNPKKLKTVIIVHGGEDERLHMIEELQQRLGTQKQVITLKEEETIRFF